MDELRLFCITRSKCLIKIFKVCLFTIFSYSYLSNGLHSHSYNFFKYRTFRDSYNLGSRDRILRKRVSWEFTRSYTNGPNFLKNLTCKNKWHFLNKSLIKHAIKLIMVVDRTSFKVRTKEKVYKNRNLGGVCTKLGCNLIT